MSGKKFGSGKKFVQKYEERNPFPGRVGGSVAEAMCWVVGGWIISIIMPTGFSHRAECGKNTFRIKLRDLLGRQNITLGRYQPMTALNVLSSYPTMKHSFILLRVGTKSKKQ